MLLFADDLLDFLRGKVGKRLLGPLKIAFGSRGLDRRHGWWQVDQPLRIGGKPTHDLERGGRVFFLDDDGAAVAGYNVAAAGDLLEIENIVVLLLGTERRSIGQKWSRRLGVSSLGINTD